MCGNTSLEEALFTASLGADMIGIVGVRSSPRYVHIDEAFRISNYVKNAVYVTDSEDLNFIEQIARRFMYVQVHRIMSSHELRRLKGKNVIAYVPATYEGINYIESVLENGLIPLIHSTKGRITTDDLSHFKKFISRSGVAGGIDVNNAHELIGLNPLFFDVSRGSEEDIGRKSGWRIRYLLGVLKL
ncbi:MAG: hypothetical protein ACP5LW_06605 [Nitrososphaeria archaeon]